MAETIMGRMKTYGNVHGKVKHLVPNTSRLTPVRGLTCLTHTTHTTQTTNTNHTQEKTMTVIEMQTMRTFVSNLPRIADALERIAKALEKNQQKQSGVNTNGEQEAVNV